MAKTVENRRVHCSIRHVDAFVIKRGDGSSTIKCSLLKVCGDECPYLRDPKDRSLFRRAPECKAK